VVLWRGTCLFWESAVVLRGKCGEFCREMVYFWGKYSGFREKWSYSGEVVSLLRGGVVISGDVGRCVPPYDRLVNNTLVNFSPDDSLGYAGAAQHCTLASEVPTRLYYRAILAQSAVMRLHVVRLSVRLSV